MPIVLASVHHRRQHSEDPMVHVLRAANTYRMVTTRDPLPNLDYLGNSIPNLREESTPIISQQ